MGAADPTYGHTPTCSLLYNRQLARGYQRPWSTWELARNTGVRGEPYEGTPFPAFTGGRSGMPWAGTSVAE
jgi:hypothetical protein